MGETQPVKCDLQNSRNLNNRTICTNWKISKQCRQDVQNSRNLNSPKRCAKWQKLNSQAKCAKIAET